jgi:HEAT repeat protein
MNEQPAVAPLMTAIDAGDDARCEALVHDLTPADSPLLVTLAADGDPDRRWWAVRALALVGADGAVPALVHCLADDDPSVRAAAAMSLGHVHRRAPAAVAPQLDQVAALLADDNGLVRQAAGDGLAVCGDDAVPALAAALRQSQHPGARSRAAAALRKIATLRAAAVLYPLLNDPNHLVRMYAYEGLDEMGLLENVLLIP